MSDRKSDIDSALKEVLDQRGHEIFLFQAVWHDLLSYWRFILFGFCSIYFEEFIGCYCQYTLETVNSNKLWL